ncbi:MAG: caspase family protein [Deltaproteobacteria bacterium]|nr:caspase family protein [Deltaproteobacteria bacterium]
MPAAAFVDNERRLLTASEDRTMKLWDLRSGKIVRHFYGHTTYVVDIDVAADGKHVVSDGDGEANFLWRLDRSEPIARLGPATPARSNGWIYSRAKFTPDGQQVLVAVSQREKTVLNIHTTRDGKKVDQIALPGVGRPAALIVVSADLLIIHDDNRHAFVISRQKRGVVTKLGEVHHLALHPNRKQLAAYRGPNLELIDLNTGDATKTYPGQLNPGHGYWAQVGFSPDGKSFLSLNYDGKARKSWYDLLDVASGEKRTTLPMKTEYGAKHIAWSPDGTTLAYGDPLRFLDLKTLESRPGPSGDQAWSPIYSPSGRYLFVDGVYFQEGNINTLASAYLWDTKEQRIARTLLGNSQPGASSFFISGSELFHLVRNAREHTSAVRVWDLATGRPRVMPFNVPGVSAVERIADGSARELLVVAHVLTNGVQRDWIGAMDKKTGVSRTIAAVAEPYRESPRLLSDAKTVRLTLREPRERDSKACDIVDLDFATGKELRRSRASVNCGPFNKDGTAVIGHEYEETQQLDPLSGQRRSTIKLGHGQSFLAYSPDGNRAAVVASRDKRLRIATFGKTEVVTTLESELEYEAAAFSSDARTVAGTSKSGAIDLIDAMSGKLKKRIAALRPTLFALSFTPDDRFVVGVDPYGVVHVVDVSKQESVMYMIPVGSSADFATVLASGFYSASKAATSAVAFRLEDRIFSFDNFDLQLNRPDRIVERMPYATANERRVFAALAEKRLRRAKAADISLAEMPTLELVGASPPSRTNDASVGLQIAARAKHGSLDRLMVVVNDVSWPDSRGISTGKVPALEKKLAIPLSLGRNQIEISVVDENGRESLREAIDITSDAPASPKLYVLGIGVSDYVDASMRLTYAAKDAKDLATAFGAAGKKYASVQSELILDREVTKERVASARSFLEKATPNDTVVIFVAGHGLLSDSLEFYFATADVDFAAPAVRGLPYAAIEGLLDGIAAHRKLLLVDTCHSGEVDTDQKLTDAPAGSAAISGVKLVSRGLRRVGKPVAGLGASLELLRELFADTRRGTGAVAISSASGFEQALESDALKNGVFTYALLEGLREKSADSNRDGHLSVDELNAWVGTRVPALTGGRQTPTMRQENLRIEFDLR